MNISECYQLGRITKPFGINGQVVFFLDVDDPSRYSSLDSALVDIKGSLVPYFFHIDKMNDNKAIVSFEELSKEQALALVGHDLYLPLTMLPKLTGNQFYFHEVKGFNVIDKEHGDIGVLQCVIDYPAQPLFQIDCRGKEILIPVIDQVIVKVDREKKELHIDAPAGLVELYLGN